MLEKGIFWMQAKMAAKDSSTLKKKESGVRLKSIGK
jgi:hypothetical protein